METTIKIFVAAPLDLEEQRNVVEDVARELEKQYEHYDHKFHIQEPWTYDDFKGRSQDDINAFIKNDADIVFFILENELKEKGGTEQEYKAAANKYEVDKSPFFRVFLKRYDEMTDVIERIEELMKTPTQRYYILYTDIKDLKAKVKDEIENYINKQIADNHITEIEKYGKEIEEKDNANKELKKKNKKYKYGIILLLCSVLSMLGLGTYLYFKPKPIPDPMLVIAGGGSVANFINKQCFHGDSLNFIHKYENSVYINQPSSSAWVLLLEESIKGEDSFKSICLSADSIDSVFLTKRTIALLDQKERIILSLLIGHDPLVAYIEKSLYTDTNSIQINHLVDMINDINGNIEKKKSLEKSDTVFLFSTSKTSGTLRVYQNFISAVDTSTVEKIDKMFDTQKCYTFFDDFGEDYFYRPEDNKKHSFIVLASENYYPKNIPSIQYNKPYVKFKNDTIKKPIYIYFLAYKNGNDWFIDKQIVQFLKEINVLKFIEENNRKSIERNRQVSVKGAKGFFSLNDTSSEIIRENNKQKALLDSVRSEYKNRNKNKKL